MDSIQSSLKVEDSTDTSIGLRTKKRNRKMKKITITSTPIINNRSLHSNSSRLDDSASFLYSDRMASLLKQINGLKTRWEFEVTSAIDAFTRLITAIATPESGNRLEDLQHLELPFDVILLMRQGNTDQAHRLYRGYVIETGFDEVEKRLKEIYSCRHDLQKWLDGLIAVESLEDQTKAHNYRSASLSTKSITLSSRQLPILWVAVFGETQGLIERMNQAHTHWTDILNRSAHLCSQAKDAFELALVWRHIGRRVCWTSVMVMVKELLVVMS